MPPPPETLCDRRPCTVSLLLNRFRKAAHTVFASSGLNKCDVTKRGKVITFGSSNRRRKASRHFWSGISEAEGGTGIGEAEGGTASGIGGAEGGGRNGFGDRRSRGRREEGLQRSAEQRRREERLRGSAEQREEGGTASGIGGAEGGGRNG